MKTRTPDTHYIFRWLEEIKSEVFPELNRETSLNFDDEDSKVMGYESAGYNIFDNDE